MPLRDGSSSVPGPDNVSSLLGVEETVARRAPCESSQHNLPCAVAFLPSSGPHAGHSGTGGSRSFSQPSNAAYRVMQRIAICVALHSLVVPNLLQEGNMTLDSGKLLVQSW